MLALVLLLSCAAPKLDAGIAMYNQLEFEKATIAFQQLVIDPDVVGRDRAQAFMWLGLSYGQLGDTDSARQSFHRGLVADATLATPPDTPPALLTIFEEERKNVAALQKPVEVIKPPQPPPAPPPTPGPNVALIGASVGAGVLAVAAIGVGGYGVQQLLHSEDLDVPAREAITSYDTSVKCGIAAGVLGGVAAVAGGLAALLAVE